MRVACRNHRFRTRGTDLLRRPPEEGRDHRDDVPLRRAGGGRLAECRSTLPPVIGVNHLLPTKARILMMLALTRHQRPSEIQRIFNAY
jgi:hypothetical protein